MQAPGRSLLTETDHASARRLYERRRDLPSVLPVWPHELEELSLDAHRALVSRLQRRLREERQRGIAGCWTYDLTRHAALARALRSELSLLTARRKAVSYGARRATSLASVAGNQS
jgi:hypothetical protein